MSGVSKCNTTLISVLSSDITFLCKLTRKRVKKLMINCSIWWSQWTCTNTTWLEHTQTWCVECEVTQTTYQMDISWLKCTMYWIGNMGTNSSKIGFICQTQCGHCNCKIYKPFWVPCCSYQIPTQWLLKKIDQHAAPAKTSSRNSMYSRTSIIWTLNYPNSMTDSSIRVFWLQVYVLLE